MSATTRTPVRWWAAAACRDHPDPSIFFPERSETRLREAQAVCARCPVVAQCGQAARERGETAGVWGGKLIGR